MGPDHTGRALRRVFRKGFAQKVARTSVVKHYGIKTLLYGVLLPGPDIGAPRRRCHARACATQGFEVGLHTYDHVRWQDHVARRLGRVDPDRVRTRHRRLRARHSATPPASHAAAGWQINAHALELEREHGLDYASDTPRRRAPSCPDSRAGASPCPQLPTTLPDLRRAPGVGRHRRIHHRRRRCSRAPQAAEDPALQVFTLHAELEGHAACCDAFEALLIKWREAGAVPVVAHGLDPCSGEAARAPIRGASARCGRAVRRPQIPGAPSGSRGGLHGHLPPALDLLGLSALIAVLWLAMLPLRPLFNPDEGRYAEIPREMLAERRLGRFRI